MDDVIYFNAFSKRLLQGSRVEGHSSAEDRLKKSAGLFILSDHKIGVTTIILQLYIDTVKLVVPVVEVDNGGQARYQVVMRAIGPGQIRKYTEATSNKGPVKRKRAEATILYCW